MRWNTFNAKPKKYEMILMYNESEDLKFRVGWWDGEEYVEAPEYEKFSPDLWAYLEEPDIGEFDEWT